MDLKSNLTARTSDPAHAILYKYLEGIRPPEEIRSQLDIGYTYQGSTIEFYEIRPNWQDATIIRHHPYAKIRFVKTQNLWKLYWRRASGKWESYTPFPSARNLEDILDCISADAHHCFYG